MDLKWEIESNTTIVGDINTSHTSMDRSSRQKITDLNDSLDQTDLIDTYSTCHPKASEYTFLKFTQYILQNRSQARLPNKSQQIQEE